MFTVSLSSVGTQTVTVGYATQNGSALAGTDYTPVSGSLTFAPGQSVQTISVPLIAQSIPQPTKQFFVNLTGPTNATVGLGRGTATILNDAPAPTVSAASAATVTEPEAGSTLASFPLTLSGPSGLPVTVNYATADITAHAGSDYTATSGTATFPPGTTSLVVNVPVAAQNLSLPTQTFALNLSAAANANLATTQVVGTIENDAAYPSASIADSSVVATSPNSTLESFTVTLSGPSGQAVSVDYATADGTAVAGTDYASTSGTLTFNPGQTSQTITVPVLAETSYRGNRSFTVSLSNPVNVDLGRSEATGAIVEGGALPALTINDVAIQEPDLGTSTAVFTVTLAPSSGLTTTVAYSTVDLSAVAGVNYTATSGTLTFAPGQTTQTISVPILDDLKVDPTLQFGVVLSSPSNATLARTEGVGSILDTDALVVTNTSDSGSGSLRDVITRANAHSGPDTITFAIPGMDVHVINVRSALPAITDPVTIDGESQPGYTGTPLVEIDGGGAGTAVDGLAITGGNSTVRGLSIVGFGGSGISMTGLGGNTIQADYLGLLPDGSTPLGNRYYGVLADNSPNNLIGGTTAEERDVISGNGIGGVYLGFAGSSGNVIEGDYIGTDARGTSAVPNAMDGVFVDNAPNNFVGGPGGTAGNVISGNDSNGVHLYGKGSTRNRVQGNLIGVDESGNHALPNRGSGIRITVGGHPKNLIGGRGPLRNVTRANGLGPTKFIPKHHVAKPVKKS